MKEIAIVITILIGAMITELMDWINKCTETKRET